MRPHGAQQGRRALAPAEAAQGSSLGLGVRIRRSRLPRRDLRVLWQVAPARALGDAHSGSGSGFVLGHRERHRSPVRGYCPGTVGMVATAAQGGPLPRQPDPRGVACHA